MITTRNGKVEDARICLNAVHVVPYRAIQAEKVIIGNSLGEEIAREAGQAAVAQAKPLEHNSYKVAVARALVKRAILACARGV
jgi:xanthine dehydrogenase YagS FAD-binding subunit